MKRYALLAFLVAVPIALVGVLRPTLAPAPVASDLGRTPSAAEWNAIAGELEDEVPARALLGGITDPLLDRRLRERGLSWQGWRVRARELIAATSAAEAARGSGSILDEGLRRQQTEAAQDLRVPEDRGVEEDLVEIEIADLVRRLLLRLPAES